ncbi:VOC family protein [Martelella soudanensis]|uniref:VOC family protein n=1 Tax=unclassified Martelella TaxID=2629616 RepID=UPI0015DDD4D9|nr:MULTISPECIES: VOC family protein [unclassified Martelella]
MINLQDVSYVRMGTRDIEGAEFFARDYLGLEVEDRHKGSVYFKSDQRAHTLCYFEGDPADQAVGFVVGSEADLDQAAASLEALQTPVHIGTTEEATLRKVKSFIRFRDPTGNTIELVVRPEHSGRRYHGTRDAGITGFSHVGLCTTNAARDEKFWTEVCNARVSDRIGDAPLLRIDEVHHTIALFPTNRAGIQHINHQVETADDIQRSYNFLRERDVKMVFGPGRHPTSTAKFLYFEGPDGMVFEYSSGVQEIADELLWRERQFPAEPKGFCSWGAEPDIKEFKN